MIVQDYSGMIAVKKITTINLEKLIFHLFLLTILYLTNPYLSLYKSIVFPRNVPITVRYYCYIIKLILSRRRVIAKLYDETEQNTKRIFKSYP